MKTNYLLARPIPREDESPASLLIRAAERNGYHTVHNMISYTKLNGSSAYLDVLMSYVGRFRTLLGILGLSYPKPEEVLERGGPGSRILRRMMKHFYPPEFFRQDGTAYCPGCLHESQYLRKIWMFRPYSRCHIHDVPLRTTCITCNQDMKIFRGTLDKCWHCNSGMGRDLPKKTGPTAAWVYDFVHQGNEAQVEDFTTLFSWATQIVGENGKPRSDEDAAELLYLYLSNQSNFGKRLKDYAKFDARHLKIKLLPLYIGGELERAARDIVKQSDFDASFSARDLDTRLSVDEAAILHGVTAATVRKLLRRNGAKDSLEERNLTLGLTLSLIEADMKRKAAILAETKGEYLTVQDVADMLQVHPEIVRSIQKAEFLPFERKIFAGSLKYVTTQSSLEEFTSKYALVGTVARKLGLNATDLTAKLAALGITPEATPKDSRLKTCLFRTSDVQPLTAEDILSIHKCPTNAGRKSGNAKQEPAKNLKTVTIKEAAAQLNLSIQKVKTLIERDFLVRIPSTTSGVMVCKKSLDKLLGKLNDENLIPLEQAAAMLGTNETYLKRDWLSLGIAEHHNLLYWELVKKSDINRILEIKSEYVNATEAGKLLDMHRTHVRNLAKQNLIVPHLIGTKKQIRLYKISDVLKFK